MAVVKATVAMATMARAEAAGVHEQLAWAAVAKGVRWVVAVKMVMVKVTLAREVAVARGAVVVLDSGDRTQGWLVCKTWWW